MSAPSSSARVEFSDVKAATLRSLDFIVKRLLPGGKREGDEWVARNPTRADAKPGSFKVNMRKGVWSDFATGESGGDMIDLVMYLRGGSNVQAMRELADILGVQARGDKPSEVVVTPKPVITAAPSEARVAPSAFPPRTKPDDKGKPFFVVAGDEGPPPRKDELRGTSIARAAFRFRSRSSKHQETIAPPTPIASPMRMARGDGNSASLKASCGLRIPLRAPIHSLQRSVASSFGRKAKRIRIPWRGLADLHLRLVALGEKASPKAARNISSAVTS
jgi:hypothetical protein